MIQPSPDHPSLTRSNWLVLTAAAVSGCGGGGAAVALLPGTGGTGVFALGAIAGFGSVIVSGIKFDDRSASVQMDGVSASASQLRLGMVASVQGERSADPTLGVASSVEVWSIAQGLVSQSSSGQFTVAGMTLQTDGATLVSGINSVASIVPGLRVAVWGLPSGASSWLATRVAVVEDLTLVSTGVLAMVASQRSVNGWMLSGSAADGLSAGQLVRVQGTAAGMGNAMLISSVKVLDQGSAALPQGEVEIEGVVTNVASASAFTLGGLSVETTGAIVSPPGAQITLGDRVEVHGMWLGGVLKASRVEIENQQTLQLAEISGLIEVFNGLGDFVVRGQRCNALSASIKNGAAANLKVGVKVKVEGQASGNVLMVTELYFLG